ncbi:MAG TPA: Rid family hydrolase [Bacteroidaceae bacterium]|nr:Rid family hydrolase [Bacteroidaceae bacterium]
MSRKYNIFKLADGIQIEISSFEFDRGVSEYHLIIQNRDSKLTFDEQMCALLKARDNIITNELERAVVVFERFFLSDAANQQQQLERSISHISDHAVSFIEQAPLNGTKVAFWAYLQSNVEISPAKGGLFEVKSGTYKHLWGAGAVSYGTDSKIQTEHLLNDYSTALRKCGYGLANSCLRTWFFVHNIELNYAGVVEARNKVFKDNNLTKETHFIASTGIAGRLADSERVVIMDTYAVGGLKESQIHYLYAPTHLNPTYQYGVSFERGTRIDYGDRRHVLISGTASIDNKGQIMHPGEIRKQTARMIENVEVLLKEANCDFTDVTHIIVYLRDCSDYEIVNDIFRSGFPDIPYLITLASVCRPGWLVEMECMAIKKQKENSIANF